jgi:hypothetical protein
MVIKTIPANEGIFIPRHLLSVGGEWVVVFKDQEIVLRPKLDRMTAHQRARERRERLRQQFGVFSDSTVLIRQDRDER